MVSCMRSDFLTSRKLDQFFTRPDVAERCCSLVKRHMRGRGDWLWVEPSAGSGAFLDYMASPRIAFDIEPRRPDIVKADFLTWQPEKTKGRIIVLGNPPFGKNSSTACKFFNHAANFADIIAFIVPRTFQKPSLYNKLDRRMHLINEWILDRYSFEFNNFPYDVPTVFQIWEKHDTLRALVHYKMVHRDFSFVIAPEAHFAFQRVGARAGLVSCEGLRKSPQSHYFLKASGDAEELFKRLQAIDWNEIKQRTAGNPSIGKGELTETYSRVYA